MRIETWLGLSALAVAGVRPAVAQSDSCTWDTCALRLRPALFGRQIVRGQESIKVAGVGFIAGPIGLFRDAPDSVRVHYDAFRRGHNTAAALVLAGLTGLIASTAVFANDGDDGLAAGLLVASFGFTVAGIVVSMRAEDHLSRTLWWFNRGLPRDP